MDKILQILMVVGVAHSSCTTLLKNSGSAKPSVTRIALEETCPEGSLAWKRPVGSQLVQFFRGDRASFTVCLNSSSAAGVAVYQLLGSSKKLLVSEEQSTVERFCLLSKCSTVSLMLEASGLRQDAPGIELSSIEYVYQHNLDERCPRCTDNCMQNIFCSSEHVFIGSVNSTTRVEKVYYSQVSIISRVPMCQGLTHEDTPTSLPREGERVSVTSACRLRVGQNYVFAGDMRHGYVANQHGYGVDQLVLGCAQRDIDYTLYFISKKLKCCSS